MSSPPLVEKHNASISSLSPIQQADRASDHEHGVEWVELVRIVFVALAAAAVWFRIWEPFPRFSIIGIAATLIGGYPIFKEAFENIVERKMTMELSMTIALLSALAIGEFFTALVITAFVLAAEVLEGLTVGRGRRAIHDLIDFLPRTVFVRRNNEELEISAENLRLGDAVIVCWSVRNRGGNASGHPGSHRPCCSSRGDCERRSLPGNAGRGEHGAAG